jgi:hypothetical protein
MNDDRRREILTALARLEAGQTNLRTDILAALGQFRTDVVAGLDRVQESLAAISDDIANRQLRRPERLGRSEPRPPMPHRGG